MIRGDGPEEARAEIIEIANRPLPPSATDRRVSGAEDRRPRARPIPSRRWGAIGVAAIAAGLLLTAAVGKVLSGPQPSVAPELAAIFPATAGGLTVISVTAANLTDSAGSGDATELAVGGWYSELRTQGPCYPADPPGGPCPPGRTASFGSTPAARFGADGTVLPADPDVSTLVPVFVDPLDPPDLVASPGAGTVSLVAPSALVLIGHFHDDRGTDCSTGAAQAVVCDPAFVVDAVTDLRGVVRTAGRVAPPGIRLSRAGVVTSIRGQVQPGGYVLEFGPVDWLANPATFSPAESSPDAPLFAGPTVWLIRGYLNGLASWMGIDDATEQAWGPLARPALANPLAAGLPRTVEGLQVQSVTAAIRIEAGCCQLVAIGGYLSNDRAPEGCPPAPVSAKPPSPCAHTRLALIDQPGSILLPNDQSFTYDLVIPPGTPSITPFFVPGTGIVDPWAAATEPAERLEPRAVILVGAFGDPRSPTCPGPSNAGDPACAQSFLVDQVAWLGGLVGGPSISIEPGTAPVRTPEEIAAAAGRDQKIGSTIAIVSIIATTRASSASVTGVPTGNTSNGEEVVWIVRLVVSRPGAPPESQFMVFDDRTGALELSG